MKHITKHTKSVACQNGVFFSYFSPADLIFSSSACTRKFILLSFADAQVSISPLTDYTSWFRSTSFRYSIRFAIPHQPIRRSPDRSVDRSVARSIARSIARSLGRSFGRSIGRSVARSIVRSFTQSLSPPPSLPLPVSIPRFPHPFPCISPPFVKILSRSVHLPPCLSPSPYLVLPNLPFPEPPESPLLQGFIQSCPLRGGHAPSSAPNDSNNFLCIFSNETHFFRHRCLICGTFISADPFEHTSWQCEWQHAGDSISYYVSMQGNWAFVIPACGSCRR